MKTSAWPDNIHRVLGNAGVRQVAYVPDSGHARLINLCRSDRGIAAVMLTTEEEGVALLAGAWLGGERGALLLQSSGAGNCINMLGMIQECRFPLLMLVTMRGEWGEFNPWQVPMGQATAAALAAAGVIVHHADDPEGVVAATHSAAQLAFNAYRAVAVLISQRVIGAKEFRKDKRRSDEVTG